MTEPEAKEKALLSAKLGRMTDVALREHGLEAIRLLSQQANETQLAVSLKHWTRKLYPLVAPGLHQQSGVLSEITYDTLDQVSVSATNGHVRVYCMRIYQFWKWMELAGFAIPFGVDFWAITPLGEERLKTDHPCRPGALDRLRTQFGVEFGDALDRLEDAHECYERGLFRPTLMLLGLAYEDLIKVLLTAKLGFTEPPAGQKAAAGQKALPQNARDRITELRQAIEGNAHKGTKDVKEAALCSLHVADLIREQRNLASHKASSLFVAAEVDELLTDGTRCFHRLAGYAP